MKKIKRTYLDKLPLEYDAGASITNYEHTEYILKDTPYGDLDCIHNEMVSRDFFDYKGNYIGSVKLS